MKPIKRYALVDEKGNIIRFMAEGETRFRDAIFDKKAEAEEMRWPEDRLVQVVITQK